MIQKLALSKQNIDSALSQRDTLSLTRLKSAAEKTIDEMFPSEKNITIEGHDFTAKRFSIGGISFEQIRQTLEDHGYKIEESLCDAVEAGTISLQKKKRLLYLVSLDPLDLGFSADDPFWGNPTWGMTLTKAVKLGLEYCPADTYFNLKLKNIGNGIHEMNDEMNEERLSFVAIEQSDQSYGVISEIVGPSAQETIAFTRIHFSSAVGQDPSGLLHKLILRVPSNFESS